MDFRTAILDVICQNEKLIAPFLDEKARRTHAFLGSVLRIPPCDRRFSEHGDGSFHPCILTQVYRQCYPHMAAACAPPQISESHPFYQLYRIDCTYFAAPRISDAVGWPVVWENDWMIEVENDPRGFAFTLRRLLDFVCNTRLGIFFVDSPDNQHVCLTEEFRVSWDAFASRYRFASDLGLQVILFPTSYSSLQTYKGESRHWIWDPTTRSFR